MAESFHLLEDMITGNWRHQMEHHLQASTPTTEPFRLRTFIFASKANTYVILARSFLLDDTEKCENAQQTQRFNKQASKKAFNLKALSSR